MRTLFKILIRLIALPFVAGVVLIASIRNYLYTLWLWMYNGGELKMHDDIFNPVTARQQFLEIKKLIEQNQK